MKISAQTEIDVFMLFVHDQWDTGPFCTSVVERLINDALTEAGVYDWRVEEPEGLDRFTVRTTTDHGEDVLMRLYSVETVKAQLPDEVVAVLEKLAANKKWIKISE